eukprot:805718-Prorocentrum_minimum.AAC.1
MASTLVRVVRSGEHAEEGLDLSNGYQRQYYSGIPGDGLRVRPCRGGQTTEFGEGGYGRGGTEGGYDRGVRLRPRPEVGGSSLGRGRAQRTSVGPKSVASLTRRRGGRVAREAETGGGARGGKVRGGRKRGIGGRGALVHPRLAAASCQHLAKLLHHRGCAPRVRT